MIQLTRVAAVEMRASGVRVNAVCPGLADTAMVDRLIPDFEAATQMPFGDLVAAKQGWLGTLADIAEVAAFLASDRASWVTVSSYVLDGGLTASLWCDAELARQWLGASSQTTNTAVKRPHWRGSVTGSGVR